MTSYVEHCNLTVRDLHATARFLMAALPDWKVRGEGSDWIDDEKQRWMHVGNELTYVSLTQHSRESRYSRSRYREPGLNHIGIVVEDAQALRDRMLAAGYRELALPVAHPERVIVSFADPDGNEFEFIEYYSTDPERRNDYSDEGLLVPRGPLSCE